MISFHWGEGTYWKGWILPGNSLSSTASLGSHCVRTIHPLKVCPPVTPLQRTQAQGVRPVPTDRGCSEGTEPFTHGLLLSSHQLPSTHSWCKGGRAELVLVLIWEGLFCFIFSNSLCKMFHNKLFLYHLLEAICEHAGRAQCINVGIHSSPPAWSEILPNTHTEGCWLLRLCSTFTALAVLKFNYFLT